MFSVDKKELQSIYSNLLKLVPKFTEIVVEVQENGLWLIVDTDTYIKVFVPAQVEKKGIFKIVKENFETLFRLRANTLKCSFNKEQNILDVRGGTKIELYVSFKVTDIQEPEIQAESSIKLKSKVIGNLKDNLNIIKFISPDVGASNFTLIKNSSDSVSFTFATCNIFAKYKFNESLSKKDFELVIPIDKLKLALSLIESEVDISLNERAIKIQSDNLTLILPTLIDGQLLGLIESCETLMSNSSLIKGCLKLNSKNMQKILDSVRSIGIGNGVITFNVKDTDIYLNLENNTGTAKDRFSIESNSINKPFKFGIPELFIDSALSMGITVSEDSTIRFGEDFKYFVLTQKNNDANLVVIGPTEVSNEDR